MATASNPAPAATPANDVDVFLGLLEAAWNVIANVGNGDWRAQHPEWQAAAASWREAYHAQLAASLAEENRTGLPSPAAAVLGFAAWLTCRDEPITFSAKHDAAGPAELVEAFRKSQGYAPPPDDFHTRLRPYPAAALSTHKEI